eukprot:5834250-Karenia_brevis.AAC.1
MDADQPSSQERKDTGGGPAEAEASAEHHVHYKKRGAEDPAVVAQRKAFLKRMAAASERPDASAPPSIVQANASDSPQSSMKPEGSRSRVASPVASQASVA